MDSQSPLGASTYLEKGAAVYPLSTLCIRGILSICVSISPFKGMQYPMHAKVRCMMNAGVAIAPVNGCLVFVDMQSSFSDPPIGWSLPYIGKLFFVNIAKSNIAPAAWIHRAVYFYPCREPPVITGNTTIEISRIKFFSEDLQKIFDVVNNFPGITIIRNA